MGTVVDVHRSSEHAFTKHTVQSIELVEGHGIAGDTHAGRTVQHLSRVARDPEQPNLRQVHLMHAELFNDLAEQGFHINPGDLGENITTVGLDLLGMPVGTHLIIGEAVLRVTGLRNPCAQIDAFAPGLLAHVIRREEGTVRLLAGIMSVVVAGGSIRGGDEIRAEWPGGPYVRLERV